MTVIRQKRIIADKHIYESPEDFKKFTEGKDKKTVKRYSQYRRRSRDLLERGFNQRYDKKVIRGHNLTAEKFMVNNFMLRKNCRMLR